MSVDLEEHIRFIEENRIPGLKVMLAPLEDGSMHVGTRQTGGPWQDITEKRIEELKSAIKMYEGIVARHRTPPVKLTSQSPNLSPEGMQIRVGEPRSGRE